MIYHINGKLVEKYPDHVVIEAAGLGYFVNISLNTFEKLKDQENIFLHTHQVIREDAHTLYGFSDKKERSLFLLLISVNGVGANTARTILSSLTPEELSQVIVDEDVNELKKVKGIGAKTAQRIIVDIKDKVEKEGLAMANMNSSSPSSNKIKDEALAALMALGFNQNSANKAIDIALKNTNDDELSVERLIKEALKNF